jgi:hypothetical protein
LGSGVTQSGVYMGRLVEEHPETAEPLGGLRIPDWEELLGLAARCYEVVGLGYMGVDVVRDQEMGPLILELNARPGLGIQIANRSGLLPRVQRIRDLDRSCGSPEERAAVAMELFGQGTPAFETLSGDGSDPR